MPAYTLRRALRALPIALLLAACDDDPASPARAIEGSYGLVRVVDRPLPTAVFDGAYEHEGQTHDVLIRANSGSLLLTHGGTKYVHVVDLTAWVDGNLSTISDVNDHGVCTREGDELSCESEYYENVSFVAVIDGNKLVIEQDLSGEAAPVAHTYEKMLPE